MERASTSYKAAKASSSRTSGGNYHLIPSAPAPSAICAVDRFESFLLQTGTVWNEDVLTEELSHSYPPTVKQDDKVKRSRVVSAKLQPIGSPSQAVPPEPVQSVADEPGPSQAAAPRSPSPESDQDNIIIFDTGTLSPWNTVKDANPITESPDTAKDANSSFESPPSKKQRREQERKERRERRREQLRQQAREEIVSQGLSLPTRRWHQQMSRASVHLIGDAMFNNWSHKDRKCNLHLHSFANLQQCINAIKTQRIQLHLPITVVALQCVRQVECLEPLKNVLSSLCRVIRTANPAGRIFITNNIPNPRTAPVLGTRTSQHNQLLLQAVTSINAKFRKVFLCDVASHFYSHGEFLRPVSAYISNEGELTTTGCFVYRSCLFREIGIIPYHM